MNALWLLLRRFTLRHWRQSPGQSAVLLLILALGIGVFFAMRLANRAVLSRFADFTGLVSQASDFVLTSPAGVLPESALREIRTLLGERPVALLPVVEITGAAPATGESEAAYGARRVYTITGLDLPALANLAIPRDARPEQREWLLRGPGEFWSLLRRDRAAWVSAELGALGAKLPLIINDRLETLEIVGHLPGAPDGTIMMDLPAAQALGGVPGRIDRIECLVEPGPRAAQYRAEARALLAAHPEWTVSSPDERRESAEGMTAALRLNLTLLSTLALLVGFYFIYQALDGAVVRRREEIATLRSLGFTERAIRAAWLAEAAVLGLAGGAVGGGLGWLGAQGTVRLVSRSVNALYRTSHVEHAPFVGSEFALSLVLGLGFSVVAGWFPARDAARTPPAQALRRHAGAVRARLSLGRGLALLTLALAAAFAPPLRLISGAALPLGGYLATGACVLGAAGLVAPALAGLARLLAPLAEGSLPLRIALSQLRRPALRQAIACACLLSAVAMAGGMVILIGSYDVTMRGWLERTFLADLYLSSEGAQSASSTNRLRPETWRAIVADPAVEDFYAVAMAPITLDGKPTLLAGGDLDFIRRRHVDMSWLVPPDRWKFATDRAADARGYASEAFMRRFVQKTGDVLTILTPSGPHTVLLDGVFADYGNERGTLLVDRTAFAQWWGHELLANLTLQLRPGEDPAVVRARLRAAHPGLNVYTNRALREQALRIFHETFAVTHALEIIGVVVAVTGLGLTLTSIFLQRRNELATLRALAWTPGEIARAAAAEGVLLSAVGLAAGLLVSVALGALLVFVVNRQAFGWTLQFHVPLPALALLAGLVLASGAAVSAGLGRWAARLPGDREE